MKYFEAYRATKTGGKGSKIGVFQTSNIKKAARMALGKSKASRVKVWPVKIVRVKDKRKKVVIYS